MPDGPDVRALRHLLGSVWGLRRPVSCLGCPFSVRGRPKGCTMLGMALVNHEDPPCTQEDWQERARTELAALLSDAALFAALARDAREESSMYARGLAEGRAAEREACCKALCPDCGAGLSARFDAYSDGWWHGNPAAVSAPGVEPARPCRADAIRRRAEEDGR
jgi:hypothetical protein